MERECSIGRPCQSEEQGLLGDARWTYAHARRYLLVQAGGGRWPAERRMTSIR